MYAYYVTRDPVMAGIMANISSGYNICQFGLTQQFTPEMRTRAEETAQQMYADYLQQHGLSDGCLRKDLQILFPVHIHSTCDS